MSGRTRLGGGAGSWRAALLLWLIAWLAPASAQPLLGQGDTADSIAVVIGNRTYLNTVPVDFAGNDADAMRDFLVRSLGFREQNVVVLKDATRNQLEDWFGSEAEPQAGKLWLRAKAGRSDVFVYYSGHGVPDLKTRQAFLLPSDGNPDRASSGYGLETLYRNLDMIKGKVGPSRQVVVMLDACFTGETGRSDGKGLLAVSAPGFQPTKPRTGGGVVKLVATSGSAPANWDAQNKLGLFTSRFLMGAAGLAAPAPAEANDNRSGQVSWSELQAYVTREVVETAQRESRREQVPEIDAAAFNLPLRAPVPAVSRAVAGVRDEAKWRKAQGEGSRAGYERYVGSCGEVCAHKDQALEAALGMVKDSLGVSQKSADELAWTRLSAQSRYQDYLADCEARGGICAYQQVARAYLKIIAPPGASPAEPRAQAGFASRNTDDASSSDRPGSDCGTNCQGASGLPTRGRDLEERRAPGKLAAVDTQSPAELKPSSEDAHRIAGQYTGLVSRRRLDGTQLPPRRYVVSMNAQLSGGTIKIYNQDGSIRFTLVLRGKMTSPGTFLGQGILASGSSSYRPDDVRIDFAESGASAKWNHHDGEKEAGTGILLRQ
ncbi:caspase family protein [Methylobacterium iners]|uniref:Peptidase C14 caspase domain-containing protein n=1 Tax=Methylobacterium iners TaxID=418707 RepID=A0ABQ4RVH1_9HYPH|nr:caspase family protein [Methylobacterium iners]GJD94719.1 hypothetical protein OCOJLMKI_1922 [Methylobacterium iners]